MESNAKTANSLRVMGPHADHVSLLYKRGDNPLSSKYLNSAKYGCWRVGGIVPFVLRRLLSTRVTRGAYANRMPNPADSANDISEYFSQRFND